MRCKPTLYLFPRGLCGSSDVGIEQWTKRGFQVLFKRASSIPRFAFFADASPREYQTEAELEKEEWKKSVGYDDVSPPTGVDSGA
jgi:hypothetical protein